MQNGYNKTLPKQHFIYIPAFPEITSWIKKIFFHKTNISSSSNNCAFQFTRFHETMGENQINKLHIFQVCPNTYILINFKLSLRAPIRAKLTRCNIYVIRLIS